ncbi:MAG: hypothetical protein ACR2OB_05700 [Solirubrobacteraceae bacterium]
MSDADPKSMPDPNPGADPNPLPDPKTAHDLDAKPIVDSDAKPGVDPASEVDAEAKPGVDPASGAEADPSPAADPSSRLQYIIEQTVFVRGTNRPFGNLTLEDARERADELKAATGFGPTARVAPVARAWRELMMALERTSAPTVGELDPDLVVELAPRLWVVPPGGTLL